MEGVRGGGGSYQNNVGDSPGRREAHETSTRARMTQTLVGEVARTNMRRIRLKETNGGGR